MAIILASQSPRRKEILTDLGIDFKIIVSDADESSNENNPEKLVEILAERKANAISDQAVENDTIIAADTVVVLGDKILGKPKDKHDAENMLTILSNNVHKVITGVCVKKGDNIIVSHDITYVYFKKLSKDTIDNYLSSNEYIDKAGSYAIQGIGGSFVEKIEGSYTNVVGLPEELTIKLLDEIKTCV